MPPPIKKSLFAQRMEKLKQEKIEKLKNTPVNYFGDCSYVVNGPEASDIHLENAQRLSAMTHEQLIEEQNKLLEEMDPTLVQFLKNRRNQSQPLAKDVIDLEEMDTGQISSEANVETVGSNPPEEVKELIYKYPHMDTLEENKLGWMGELSEPKPPPLDQPYEARFDFDGNLLPYCGDNKGVLKGLHNHGEEQERPGYSMKELIQLSRSSVLNQRVLALRTLANVLANAFNYEMCFDKPLIPMLLDAELFLLLRFSLDDECKPVILESVVAMCNLLVNHVDEVCLDLLLGCPYGIHQPGLGVILEMKPDDISELKDPELLRVDVIKGALRTDLLHRLRYLLEYFNTDAVKIKHIIKILIRFVRHSYAMTEVVVSCPGLLQICRSLLDKPVNNSYFPEALKLFRIISVRSRTLAVEMVNKYSLLTPIFKFVSGEIQQNHPEIFHLTLESFYTWQTIIVYHIATESIREMIPVFSRLFQAHLSFGTLENAPTSDIEHATALLTTILAAAKVSVDLISDLVPLIIDCCSMWITRFYSLKHHNLVISKLIGAILRLATVEVSFSKMQGDLNEKVESLLNCKAFISAFESLRKCSWFLCGNPGESPENLPCLGSIPPALLQYSSFPLIFSLATFVLSSNNCSLKRKLCTNEIIVSYVKDIIACENAHTLCRHWYARQELILLMSLTIIFNETEDKSLEALYNNLAFFLLPLIQSGDKQMLPQLMSKMIFNKRYFSHSIETIDENMKMLSMEENGDDWQVKKKLIDDAISRLDEIEDYYIKELGLFNVVVNRPPVTLTGQLNSTESALPADWTFYPILRIYNNDNLVESELEKTVVCLKWVLLLEELKPGIVKSFNVTARYCRVCCVFLAGNNFFRDVSELLGITLAKLLAHSNELDFDKPIEGLSSFYDFYRQLLEQFAAVSYCDQVFGQFVLVPLQQRHNPKYKKLVWSEMAAILRLLSTPVQKVNMSEYLNPLETDPDILLTYLHSLATGKLREEWCPILYTVAVHHVNTYISTKTDRVSKLLSERVNKLGNQELKQVLSQPKTFS